MNNYTIFTQEQITPKYITVHGATQDELALNTGSKPVYPVGASLNYMPVGFDRYSDDPAKRKVLLNDPNGAASRAEILAVFPGWLDSLMNIVRAECQKHILATYPVWYQSNVAMGIYSAPLTDKCRDDIAAVITESNRCEQLIYDGQAYTLNLPTIGV